MLGGCDHFGFNSFRITLSSNKVTLFQTNYSSRLQVSKSFQLNEKTSCIYIPYQDCAKIFTNKNLRDIISVKYKESVDLTENIVLAKTGSFTYNIFQFNRKEGTSTSLEFINLDDIKWLFHFLSNNKSLKIDCRKCLYEIRKRELQEAEEIEEDSSQTEQTKKKKSE